MANDQRITRRQTRGQMDPLTVLAWIADGHPPAQGWISVAEEAVQRVMMLEARIAEMKRAVNEAAEVVNGR